MSEAPLPFATQLVALPTPFDEQGKVDLPALGVLLDYLLQHEAEGVALLTEAAEDPFLLPEERRAIVEKVGDAVGGAARLFVSISAPATREAVDLARFAESKGTTGILLAPPGVPGLGYRELYRHLDRVIRATSLPVLLTVRPNNAVALLSAEEQATLAKHPGLVGAFLSQPSQADVKTWARRFKKRKGVVLTGCALTFMPMAKAGAAGVVCALSMLAVQTAKKLLDAVRRGDADTVRRLERRTEPAVRFLGPPRPLEEQQGVEKLAAKLAQRPLTPGPSAPFAPYALIKAGLLLQGHKKLSATVRPPSEPASQERVQRLQQVLKSAELLS